MVRASATDVAVNCAAVTEDNVVWAERRVRRTIGRSSAAFHASARAEEAIESEEVDPEREFILAMESYKKQSGRMFPTWSEVLEVLRDLGYAKTEAGIPTDLPHRI